MYLTPYVLDLFNNELITGAVSNRRGDRSTYYRGLYDILGKKNEYKDFITILHSDHGSVYSSKEYNEILKNNRFVHSMSVPGTPIENGAMEAINGWTKEELLRDFMIKKGENINEAIENYIYYFNNERPAVALNYLTPMQYKKTYAINEQLLTI